MMSLSTNSHSSPRVALVLGSGGVRSIAGVGIADVLARSGIPINLVAGCSSGALFGAVVAMKMSADDAVRTATSLWSDELTQQPRWRAYAQLIAPRLAGFDADFSLRDDRLIAARVERAFGDLRLEQLPIPLRVAATDAATGSRVVLRAGRVTDALRASIALPFVFPSIELDGRRLVDGVVSDPLPISAVSEADVVVALELRGSMPRRVDRASRMITSVSTAMINNLMDARTQAAVAAGKRVVTVTLELDRRVGLWETGALPYLFDAGRAAATRCLPALHAALGERSVAKPAAA